MSNMHDHVDDTLGGGPYKDAALIEESMRGEADRRAEVERGAAPAGGRAGSAVEDPGPLTPGPDGQHPGAGG